MENTRHHRSVGKSNRAAGHPPRAGALLGDSTTPRLTASDAGLWTTAGGHALVAINRSTIESTKAHPLSEWQTERVVKSYFLRGRLRLSANRRIKSLNRCGSSTKSACPAV